MVERAIRSLVGLAVLAGLSGILWLEGFGPHTDDGCRTEVHCLACRSALVRRASGGAPIDAPPDVVAVEAVVPPALAIPQDGVPGLVSSRGPPFLS